MSELPDQIASPLKEDSDCFCLGDLSMFLHRVTSFREQVQFGVPTL